MSVRVIALVNQKGGVGKTTTAVNIAGYLGKAGKKVLLVDLDPQGNATSGLGIKPSEIEFGIYQALGNPAEASRALQDTIHGVTVAPASPDLAGANVDLVTLSEREFRLRSVINTWRNDFDYILIDNSPSLGLLAINGLVAADEVLIPVQAEYYALEGLRDLLHTIHLVQEHLHQSLGILGAVVTMYDVRNSLSAAVLKELQQYFPNKVFSSIIPRNVRLAEAPSFGKPIVSYDPTSRGALAYESLVNEILHLHR